MNGQKKTSNIRIAKSEFHRKKITLDMALLLSYTSAGPIVQISSICFVELYWCLSNLRHHQVLVIS